MAPTPQRLSDEPDADQHEGSGRPVASRFEAFEHLARARAAGEVVPLPRLLTGDDRRMHVRQTLREDHQFRIANRSDDAEAKFDKLAGSLFSFFRGTSLLFYRDMAGEDSRMPTVLALGDVHPENFGVMPNSDNVPIFAVNDFDEAYYAPFTWDLKRGATGFMIAAAEEGGYGRKRQIKIAGDFVRGYIDGIVDFLDEGDEVSRQMRLDNSPALIRAIIEDNLESRSGWLADDYHDEYGKGFRADDDELIPVTSRREEFQEIVNRLVADHGIQVPTRAGDMHVKDVAVRRGQGTASLGLARYYLLIQGTEEDGSADLIIEMKQARRSALAGLVPPSEFGVDGRGDRIVHAHRVQLVHGDVFYGHVDFEDTSFMSRERAPFRGSVDLDDLSKGEWRDYARICGGALAHAHALSDEVGNIDHDLEPQIVDSIGVRDLFVDDVVRYAADATDRAERDHEFFRTDHALGAFRSVDIVYR